VSEIVIPVANASAGTRVHVIASHFQPEFDIYSALSGYAFSCNCFSQSFEFFLHTRSNAFPTPKHFEFPSCKSTFLQATNLSTEHQYIIDRQTANKRTGNMLEKPRFVVSSA